MRVAGSATYTNQTKVKSCCPFRSLCSLRVWLFSLLDETLNQRAQEQTWSFSPFTVALRLSAGFKDVTRFKQSHICSFYKMWAFLKNRSADGFSFLRRPIKRNRPQVQMMSPVSGPDRTRPDRTRDRNRLLMFDRTQTAERRGLVSD